jgi:hypothetical protein
MRNGFNLDAGCRLMEKIEDQKSRDTFPLSQNRYHEPDPKYDEIARKGIRRKVTYYYQNNFLYFRCRHAEPKQALPVDGVAVDKAVPKLQDKHVGIENIQEDSQVGERNSYRDWHNWTQIQTEAQRVGPGEQVSSS